MNKKVVSILDDLRERFAELYGDRLIEMVLYGSRARGDAEPGSDIDILVVLRGPVNSGEEIARTGNIVSEISLKYDEAVICTFIDEERYRERNGPLLRNIRKEGVRI